MKHLFGAILVVCLALIGSMLFAPVVQAEGNTAVIVLGASSITPENTIWFGDFNDSPVEWQVLGEGSTGSGKLLLSKYILTRLSIDGSVPYVTNWQGSDAQSWCESLYNNSLTGVEQSALIETTKHDDGCVAEYSGGACRYDASDLDGDTVFFLSAQEVMTYLPSEGSRPALLRDNLSETCSWWLRVPTTFSGYWGLIDGYGGFRTGTSNAYLGARPAVNLDADAVLFISAAEGGKPSSAGNDEFGRIAVDSQSRWKLTLLDSSREFATSIPAISDSPGSTIDIPYSGAVTGDNEFISAIICDSDGPVYYASVPVIAASGTVEFTLPNDLADGSYTLKVFNEQKNGDKKSDHASAFQDILLTVRQTIQLTSDMVTWEDGYTYRAVGDVTIQDRVMVSGSVTLQLDEGATLTCAKGINVFSNKRLTIQGSGTLIANASGYAQSAGIGGSFADGGRSSGAIVINGGVVTATGGDYGAGIGAGMYGYSSGIVINGGVVTATGGKRGAGIGGGGNYNWAGSYGNVGTITINGGVVTATGSETGAGIGSGGGATSSGSTVKSGNVSQIIITGGQVTASSPRGASIGPGLYGTATSIKLGWTKESDFIDADSIMAESYTFLNSFHYFVNGENEGAATPENLAQKGADSVLTPWLIGFAGEGTADAPYLIESAEDWQALCDLVGRGKTDAGQYANAVYQLSESIYVTTTLGNASHPFNGVFDGDGNTLTVSLVGEGNQGLAPFGYINGATVKNLHTAGTVSGGMHCSGLVGFAEGTNQIENCEVAVAISGSSSYCGGVIGHGMNSITTLSDVIFSGSITGGQTVGTLWGWSTDGAHPSLTDCMDVSACDAPIGCGTDEPVVTRTYYLNAGKTAVASGVWAGKGQPLYRVTAAEGITVTLNGTAGLLWQGVIYGEAGEALSLSLALTETPQYPDCAIASSAGTLTETDGSWTLTMPEEAVTIGLQFPITMAPTENGTVMADAEYGMENQTITLAFTPDDFCQLAELTVSGPDGEAVSLTEENTFIMPAFPVTVTAVFEPEAFALTIGTIVGPGTVTAGQETAIAGENVHLTITPEPDYELWSLTITAEGGEEIPYDYDFAFEMPPSPVTITAEFGERRYEIVTDQNIVPSAGRAVAGELITLTVTEPEDIAAGKIYYGVFCTPEGGEGFFIEAVDGVYRFGMPEANVRIVALVDWPEDLVLSSGVIEPNKYAGSLTLRTVTIEAGVTSIGSAAFNSCRNLTSISIAGPASIEMAAFSGDTSLTTVTLGDGITSIGTAAFNGCRSLEQINLPAALTNLGAAAFSGCASLKSITIPGGVTTIQSSAFQGCSGLETIILCDGAQTISGVAFNGCASLRTLEIPETVTSIGNSAFRGCALLETLILPETLTSLGDGAFAGCASLKTLKIPAALANLNMYSYFSGHQLEILTSPAGNCLRSMLAGREREVMVTSGEILAGTFSGSRTASLQSLTLCPGVTAICSYAFDHTSNLTELSIPATVTRIEAYAFYYWSALTDIWYDGTEEEWALIADPNWASTLDTMPVVHFKTPVFGAAAFTFPAALTTIEESAFEGMTAMTIVDASHVTSIGRWAFKGCTGLTQIRLSANCAIDETAFDGCGTVYVFAPAGGTTETYCQSADNPCEFVALDADGY